MDTTRNLCRKAFRFLRMVCLASAVESCAVHDPAKEQTSQVTGAVSSFVDSVPCSAWSNAITSTNGAVYVNAGDVVDSYQSNLGTYGGTNVGAQGAIQAESTVLGVGASLNGAVVQDMPSSLAAVHVPVDAVNLPLGSSAPGNFISQTSTDGQTLAPGDYVAANVTIGSPGSLMISPSGRVRIWVTGALNLGGTENLNGVPNNLAFLVTSSNTVNVNSGGSLFGLIYAPTSPVNVDSPIFGSVVGSYVVINSGGAVHLDLSSECGTAPVPAGQSRSVLTQANDNGRSGAYVAEGYLKLANVLGANQSCLQQPQSGPNCYATAFGRLAQRTVRGDVSAQPLYVHGAQTAQGTKNLLIVATRENYVYGIDADNVDVDVDAQGKSGSWLLWDRQFAHPELDLQLPRPHNVQSPCPGACCDGNLNPGCPNTIAGMTDGPNACNLIPQHVGIMSTPVIDMAANPPAMYFVYRTGYPPDRNASGASDYHVEAHYYLHKIDLSGNDYDVDAPCTTATGKCDVEIQGVDAGQTFDPTEELQRPALLLQNGFLYIAFGSPLCDRGGNPFCRGWPLGWVFTYGTDLFQRAAYTSFRDDPKNSGDTIWQTGKGLMGDGSAVYAFTGNSTCDQGPDAPSCSGIPGTVNPAVCPKNRSTAPGLNEAVLQLTFLNARDGGLRLLSHYQDQNWSALDAGDVDLGSAGPILVPGTPWIVGGGKQGLAYTFFRGAGNPLQPVAQSQATLNLYCGGIGTTPSVCGGSCPLCQSGNQKCACTTDGYDQDQTAAPNIHGGLVAWQAGNGSTSPTYMYSMAEKDVIRQFTATPTSLPTFQTTAASDVRSNWGMPGGFLSVSANGTSDGILWATTYQNASKRPDWQNDPPTQSDALEFGFPGAMYALNAVNMGLLWKDDDASLKFPKGVSPTIADGRVFRPLMQENPWQLPEESRDPVTEAPVVALHGVIVEYGLNSIPPVVAENYVSGTQQPSTMVTFEVDQFRTLNYSLQSGPSQAFNGWIGLSGNVKSAPAAIGTLPNSGMEVYFVSGTNKMFCSFQSQAGQGFSTPQPVDGFTHEFNFSPAITTQPSGARELFAVQTDGTLVHTFSTGNCNNTGWQVLAPGPFGSTPAVGHNSDGRLEVFLLDANGAMWHMFETQANAALGSWSGPIAFPDGTDFASPPVVSVNADGRMELFAVDAGGGLRHIWQTAPSQAFVGWAGNTQLLASGFSTVPAMAVNKDLTMELAAVDASGNMWRWRQMVPNKAFVVDASQEPVLSTCTSSPAFGVNSDGRLELFASCSSAANGSPVNGAPGWELYHDFEISTTLTLNEFSSPLIPTGINTYPPWQTN